VTAEASGPVLGPTFLHRSSARSYCISSRPHTRRGRLLPCLPPGDKTNRLGYACCTDSFAEFVDAQIQGIVAASPLP
jgi:hypothetical protein